MERNYNIHNMKPKSCASFSLVQAKHEDHDRDEKEITLVNKKLKQKKKGSSRERDHEVKLSTDPQSVAARERRHRISERFKILQSLVPGGTKMDTVSMLDEAIQYVKFLKSQIWLHQAMLSFNHPHHDHDLHHDHDHDLHHVLASSDQQYLSSSENDQCHLNMDDQMHHHDHDHLCFYVEGNQETMSFIHP